jgi:hypothetical protein
MSAYTRTIAVAICTALAGVPSTIDASSCNHPIVVEIKMRSNSTCWVHKGTGTHSFGQFLKGQKISVGAASGTSYDTSGDLSWTSRDPWQINIAGPGGFQQYESDGVLYAKLPANGNYVVSLGPCAIWGAPGTVIVCASDPRLTIE